MKSINEFATEYAQDKYLPVQTSQAVKAGADYVLEELKKTIERAEYYSDMSLKSRFYEDLKYMIQELKK